MFLHCGCGMKDFPPLCSLQTNITEGEEATLAPPAFVAGAIHEGNLIELGTSIVFHLSADSPSTARIHVRMIEPSSPTYEEEMYSNSGENVSLSVDVSGLWNFQIRAEGISSSSQWANHTFTVLPKMPNPQLVPPPQDISPSSLPSTVVALFQMESATSPCKNGRVAFMIHNGTSSSVPSWLLVSLNESVATTFQSFDPPVAGNASVILFRAFADNCIPSEVVVWEARGQSSVGRNESKSASPAGDSGSDYPMSNMTILWIAAASLAFLVFVYVALELFLRWRRRRKSKENGAKKKKSLRSSPVMEKADRREKKTQNDSTIASGLPPTTPIVPSAATDGPAAAIEAKDSDKEKSRRSVRLAAETLTFLPLFLSEGITPSAAADAPDRRLCESCGGRAAVFKCSDCPEGKSYLCGECDSGVHATDSAEMHHRNWLMFCASCSRGLRAELFLTADAGQFACRECLLREKRQVTQPTMIRCSVCGECCAEMWFERSPESLVEICFECAKYFPRESIRYWQA